MKPIIILASALSLTACQLALPKLPTPAEICAMPAPVLEALAEQMNSTPADLTLACFIAQ